MTAISDKRRHLRLLAADDLQRFRERRLHYRSAATWAADIGFWLVYGGGMGLVAYIAFCAPHG
jgi:hypothetical protein